MADATDKEEDRDDDEREETEGSEPATMSVADLELESLRNQSQDYKDKYLRLLAESENTRKRLQKERQEMIQYAQQNLICDFLHPIDQMENALKHTEGASDEVKQWSIGFKMILTHFKDVLTNNGVEGYSSLGTEFDPHFHEAVEMVVTDKYPAGYVVEESVRGYKMGDRVLRPACVKVAKAPEKENN